jgi:hypothetical protein
MKNLLANVILVGALLAGFLTTIEVDAQVQVRCRNVVTGDVQTFPDRYRCPQGWIYEG